MQKVKFCWYCGRKLTYDTSKSKRGLLYTERKDHIGHILIMHKTCADKYDCEISQNNNYLKGAI